MLIDAKGFYDYDSRESGNIMDENEFEDENFWYVWYFKI